MPRYLLLSLTLLVSCSSPPAPSPIASPGTIADNWSQARGRYNRIYSTPDQHIVTDKPSAFLLECLHQLSSQDHQGRSARLTAIDIGAGSGRNSIPLAQAGYSVTAIDIAPVGLSNIRAAAGHLPIQTLEADIRVVTFHPNSLDLAAAIYFHMTEELIESLKTALRPGGALIIDALPGDAEPGYDQPGHTPLPDHFPGWQIERYETVSAIPDWDWQQKQQPAPIIHFFARKPPAAK